MFKKGMFDAGPLNRFQFKKKSFITDILIP